MTEVGNSGTEKRSYFEPNVCRLCSFASDKVLPIFDTSGSKFDAKITQCFSCIKITPGDGKPQQICLGCITKLNIYYEFLQLCIHSDSHFDSLIRACRLKEQQEAEMIAQLSQNWDTSNFKPQSSDGLIVLSKLDQPLSESSLQDLVVVVELKYKDGGQSSTVSEPASISGSNELETIEDWSPGKNVSNDDVSLLNSRLLEAQQRTSEYAEPQEGPTSLFRFDNELKEYECLLCTKRFRKRTRLNSHLACHTDNRPHKCDECGKAFAMKWDLNVHLRVHRKDIACSRCDKAFSTKSKLARHFRVHTGERPYNCNYCGRGFGDKRNLDNHLRTHTGIKPFSCSICGKTFSVRSHMVEHLNAHKKGASFSCALCNKDFRWRANYKKHLKTHSLPTIDG